MGGDVDAAFRSNASAPVGIAANWLRTWSLALTMPIVSDCPGG